MKKTKKIIGINLIIFAIYGLIGLIQFEGLIGFVFFFHAAHPLICLFISIFYFSKKEKEIGKAFLLSAAVILLVSFTVCTGIILIYIN